MVYGYKVKDETDELVALVDLATDQFSQMSAPGAYLVDVFPARTSKWSNSADFPWSHNFIAYA